ncbi:MAG: hypothetical protein AAGM84_11920 [Pseudomonadota bacterium]
MTARFHILRDEGTLTLARHLPPRFDVQASAHLPGARAVRLAHQVRQDLWRALQNVRGFSPVVRLEADGAGWHVTAGGRVMGRVPQGLAGRIAALLEDPARRARWIRCAS